MNKGNNLKGWRECKLGDVVIFGNGKSRPLSEGTIPIYGGNGILGYCDKSNYQGETIIIGRVGAYCGSVYYENKPIWISDNALGAKVKDDNNLKFIFYFLKNLGLNQFAEGSSHPLITQTLLKAIDITIPSKNEQRAIASVLSSLDDKIDLLHRQNKTLEAMAEALFRQWFVEPCKNGLPEGWAEGKLGELVEFKKGRKPASTYEFFIEGSLPQILIETFDTGVTFYSDPTDMVIAELKDILVVMDGASSGRIEIGYKGIVGSTIGLFRPLDKFKYPLFLYYFLKNNEDYIKENATGSAIPHADKALILDLDVCYKLDSVEMFEEIVSNYFIKRLNNKIQIRTLEKLRDLLLPKLISGEIRVQYE